MLNTDQARIINPILTKVAQGYSQADLVGSKLFPEVSVRTRKGTLLSFGKEAFLQYNTRRSPGADIPKIGVAYGSSSYALYNHALGYFVPREVVDEAQKTPQVDLVAEHMTAVLRALKLELEVEQATLATTAANYGSQTTALSGSTCWDHADSDPIHSVMDAKETVRASVGVYPNTLLIGPKVFTALKQHSKIIDRIKYTGRDNPTLDLLANLFEVDEVVVGKAVTADPITGAFSDVWGKVAVLVYSAKSPSSRTEPSYGYTYRLEGTPVASDTRFNESNLCYEGNVQFERAALLTGSSAGYLYTTVVA